MMNGIKNGAELPDRTPDRRRARQQAEAIEAAAPAAEPEPAPAPDADLRLMIERDEQGAYYVYKLIDRTTGKVVAERPRDQVAHLAEEPEYRAGTVISTKA